MYLVDYLGFKFVRRDGDFLRCRSGWKIPMRNHSVGIGSIRPVEEMQKVRNFAKIFLVVSVWGIAELAVAGEPIYIQPGNCVMVGLQQVCALKSDAISAPGEVSYACRYAEHKGGDLPGYKTYGLIKIINKADGSSAEVLIKDFGMKGKEKCDEAAADRKK